MDLSILIVHYNTPRLLRQTLRGIVRSAPQLRYEVLVGDNNPRLRVGEMLKREFPEVIVDVGENIGFGRGMNKLMEQATGRYICVFNPDIAVFQGSFEKLVRYLDEHDDVGMVGPQLLNPDGTIQHSCYRFIKPETVVYRRVPFLRNLPFAKREIGRYVMEDWDHASERDVEYLLGAALLVRREAVDEVGRFDPEFFMYFEDQDWCRRFWKAGWRVVYYPGASMIHYHRRETAEGGFIQQLRNPLTRIQMKSARHYFRKYKGEANPRLIFERSRGGSRSV